MNENNVVQNGTESKEAESKPTVKCVCTVCGREMVPDSMFCTVCGAPVITTRTEPPKPAPPPKQLRQKKVKPVAQKKTEKADSAVPTDVQPVPEQKNQTQNVSKYIQIGLLVLAACVAVCVINLARVKILPNVLTFVRNISEETVSKSVKDFSKDEEEVKTASTPNPPSTPIPTPVEIKNTVDINQINSIIGTDANRADISVCIYDLKNKAYYRTGNSAKKMSASAMINVPILYIAENGMKNHDVSWSSRVRFKYMYSGREVIKSNQNGSEFELGYLLEQMMSYSDNNITNSLIDYWGSSYIEFVCAQNGYNSVEIQKYLGESSQTRDNYICADDAVNMMREMYESGVAIDEDYLKSCFRISDSARFDGLGKYLPSEAGFLNHNALTSTIYNEIGIIYSDKSEYIIAVLSNNGNSETSADTVARVSDYVYRELNK